MNRIRTNMQQHPIVIVSFDDEYAARVTRELQDIVPTLHVSPLIRTLQASMESLKPSIAVFDLQTIKTEDHSIFEIMASMNAAFPLVRKIALGNQSIPAQVIAAMKAGACDFADRNASPDEIRDLITRQMGQVRTLQNEAAGRVLALISGRENEGENEICANLAVHIASGRPKGDVLLLDLNLEESQLDIEFNVEVTYSVRNAIDELLRLDKPALLEVLGTHSSGLCLMPLTTRNRSDDEISPQELATLLSALRNLFSIVIVNAGCLRDRDCRPYLIPLCDKLLLVCPQLIGSVRVARDILSDYPSGPEELKKLGLVVTKYDPGIELTATQIAGRIGIPLVGTLPTAWVQLANSHNQGVPLMLSAPGSRYARAVRDLAHVVAGGAAHAAKAETSSPFEPVMAWFGALKRAS